MLHYQLLLIYCPLFFFSLVYDLHSWLPALVVCGAISGNDLFDEKRYKYLKVCTDNRIDTHDPDTGYTLPDAAGDMAAVAVPCPVRLLI